METYIFGLAAYISANLIPQIFSAWFRLWGAD